MRKRRLKPAVKISALGVLLIVGLLSVMSLTKGSISGDASDSSFTYVNDYIFDNYYPVVNQEEKVTRPYTSEKVTIYRNFYDSAAEEANQEKSIIYHDGIYMQNSGVDYTSDETFDVVSSMSGTVTNVTDDTLLGKTIEIKNSNEITMTYQSLGDVLVKKGDTITQGQIIGKSGTCSLNSEVKESLHVEIYKNGQVLNPESYYDKLLTELLKN